MYYVYVLISEDGKKYIGYTSNLKERVETHNRGGSKYTRTREWQLVYYEAYLSKKDALLREKRLKQDGRAKRALINRLVNSLDDAPGLKWVRD